MKIEAPFSLETIKSEAEFQELVVTALRYMGWVVIHVKEMFGNPKGLPDLLCFKGQRGQMIELKIIGNTLSAGQRRWQERWVPEDTEVLLIYNRTEDWNKMMEVMAS